MNYTRFVSLTLLFFVLPPAVHAQRPMEYLDRSLVAMQAKKGVYLTWRMLGTDDPEIGFNLYRNGTKVNAKPITETTNYQDDQGKVSDKYFVETLLPGGKTEKSGEVEVWALKGARGNSAEERRRPGVPYRDIPLADSPGENYTPGDTSVGDLDGDGTYELVFEWEGNAPYLDAVTLEGKSLWRVSLGPNVTSNGMPFMVYDLDGDGKAEVACVTAPGSKDSTGNFLSKGPAAQADHFKILKRNRGRLFEDPAFITVFDGETGKERETIPFWPPIGPESEHQKIWDDNYGQRAGGIKAALLYTKEHGPLVVYTRGIYSRVAMAAYSFDGKKLTEVWRFDTLADNEKYKEYRGQGNHSLAVGDVDGDGSDELIYGACAFDHDGTPLYSTGFGHGDSHALGDFDPDHPGLEFFQGHEGGEHGITFREAGTGKVLWEILDSGDVGRAWAGDVDPKYRGAECTMIGKPHKNYDCKGNAIPTNYNPYSQPVYFDGRPYQAVRGGNIVEGEGGRIFTGWHYSAGTVHGSKNDTNLTADIIGDWREEIIMLRSDKKAFVMFSSWIPTKRKNYTLMHDPTYRMNIAVQNVGYNQPAHPGFFFADGMPKPEIKLIRHEKP